MAAKVSYFKIGLFVVVACTLGVIGVVVLGAAALFEDTISVVTYVNESVQGLAVGAPVKVRGVQIGEVAEIVHAGDRYALGGGLTEADKEIARFASLVVVTMKINNERMVEEFKKRKRLTVEEVSLMVAHAGWRARLASAGLTAPPYMEFVDSGPILVNIAELPWQEQHRRQLYIPATRSREDALWMAIERISRNLEKADIAGLVKSLESLIREDLSPAIAALDTKIAPVLDNLAAATQELPDTLKHVRATSARIDRLTKSLDTAMAEDVAPTLAGLKRVVADLQAITGKEIQPILANLNDASGKTPEVVAQVNVLLRRLNLSMSATLAQLEQLMANLRQISDNARELSDRTSRYPAHTLFGEPPPHPLGGKD